MKRLMQVPPVIVTAVLSVLLAVAASIWSFRQDYMLAYGDAESHLNIAKRVTDSLTPGLAQLGGIWLPLPHLLMVPFTAFDPLWRTGLAGAIVSGVAFVVASIYLYRLLYLVTKNAWASVGGVLVFSLNPNVLYMQSTAMTELPLIAFFILSTYYFMTYLKNTSDILSLILAAGFGFAATLSRYDGWFLVGVEAGLLGLYHLTRIVRLKISVRGQQNRVIRSLLKSVDPATAKDEWHQLEGKVLMFSTLAFLGIFMWLLWDKLILNDAFYFTNSPFSAKSQQQGWFGRGELPAYHNLRESVLYYTATAFANIGFIPSVLALMGLVVFLVGREYRYRVFLTALLGVPFVFYIVTLFLGQSVIFIPSLTPSTFEWTLFNVRYGIMAVPAAAFFTGYLLHRALMAFPTEMPPSGAKWAHRGSVAAKGIAIAVFVLLFILQGYYYVSGKQTIVTLDDGVRGLSSAKRTDAQRWLNTNYNGGLVLVDDYARTLSIVRSTIPMRDVIYIGNKPYWQESLENPEKYATWVVLQKDDTVWKTLYANDAMQKHLYAFYEKAYTSPDILIFKRKAGVASAR